MDTLTSELNQAQRLRATTGEEIHLFDKDVLDRDTMAVEGTIRSPRRPVQLERIVEIVGTTCISTVL